MLILGIFIGIIVGYILCLIHKYVVIKTKETVEYKPTRELKILERTTETYDPLWIKEG